MRKQFEKDMRDLKDSLLKMGVMVEEVIEISIKSLLDQDIQLADKVIELDDKVDVMEKKIEEKCLELIVLQQPRAIDLREISSVLKIITDLERIGDHGVNIAKVTKKIGNEKFIKPLIDLPKMADIAKKMMRKSLDSFVNKDVELAKEVAEMDDLIDDIYEDIYTELLEMLSNDKEIMSQVTNLLFIGRYIERIGDHTTNICERIIYMISGDRVEY